MIDPERSVRVNVAVGRLLLRLGPAIRALRVLPAEHPARARIVEGIARVLAAVYAAGGETVVHADAHHLWVELEPVAVPPGLVAAVEETSRLLAERGCGGFAVSAPMDVAATERLLRVFTAEDESHRCGPGAMAELLDTWFVTGFRFLARAGAAAEGGLIEPDPAVAGLRLYLRAVRCTERALQRGLTSPVLLEFTRVAAELALQFEAAPARALALATDRDLAPYHLRHPFHVAVVAVALARRSGLGRAALGELAWCALTADCGLAELPDDLRRRPGGLDDESRDLMQGHPRISVRLLLGRQRFDETLRRGLLVAFEHHRGLDGSGYPEVLRAPRPHPYSRIVAVADTWDALRSTTPWREAATVQGALRTLRAATPHFHDSILVEHLALLVAPGATEGA